MLALNLFVLPCNITRISSLNLELSGNLFLHFVIQIISGTRPHALQCDYVLVTNIWSSNQVASFCLTTQLAELATSWHISWPHDDGAEPSRFGTEPGLLCLEHPPLFVAHQAQAVGYRCQSEIGIVLPED